MEENCFIRLKGRNIRICNSREIFAGPKKEFGRGGDETMCYDLRLKVLSDRTTLVLSDTRELDRVPKTK